MHHSYHTAMHKVNLLCEKSDIRLRLCSVQSTDNHTFQAHPTTHEFRYRMRRRVVPTVVSSKVESLDQEVVKITMQRKPECNVWKKEA